MARKGAQFLYVRSKVRETFSKAVDLPVVFVAAFDNCEREQEYHPVWIMHRDGFSDFVPTRDDITEGQHYAVSPDGVTRRGCLPEGYLCLEEWLLPASGPQTLTVKRVSDAHEWTIVVNSGEFISDETLNEMGFQ